ncbi:MAG: hypothetical protein KDE26_10930 [Bacteroidetes bacterium]|nr:hypothetical protein [Bacteroidota bacterium]
MKHKIEGRAIIASRRIGIPEVFVHVYWAKPSADLSLSLLQLLKDGAILNEGSVQTNVLGEFSIIIDSSNKLGKTPTIIFVITARKVGGRREEFKTVYTSQIPLNIGQTEYFELEIDDENLKDTFVNLVKLSRLTPLNKAEEKRKEIKNWHKGIISEKRKEIETLRSKSKEAFKNFRPSKIPKHLKNKINYLEDTDPIKRKDVTEQVHRKAFDKLNAENKNKKERVVNMDKKGILSLGLDNNKEIGLPWSEFLQIFEGQKEFQTSQINDDSALSRGLESIKRRRDAEKEVIDQLFKFLTQEF